MAPNVGAAGNRGFGEVFAEKKGQLDELQRDMANILPSMPGMPVSKFYDLSLGIDFHPTLAPPSFGVPVPVPHIGMVYDIMGAVMAAVATQIPEPEVPEPPVQQEEEGDGTDPDDSPDSEEEGEAPDVSMGDVALNLLKGMAPTVETHGRWIGQAGISIQHLPGVILHALPSVTPMASSEMWMGSSTVLADGCPCSTQFHPALSCNIVGFPSILRKLKPPKPKVSLMAPTAALTTITSGGRPVLVGGPPTIDLFQIVMKLGLKGLGKLAKGGARLIKKGAKSASKAVKKAVRKAKIKKYKLGKKFQKHIDGKKPGKFKNMLQKTKCFIFGEPVDAATGRVYHENVDFELSGPIPLVWERKYYSDAEINGSLGYNWHHSYNMGIHDDGNVFSVTLSDGREVEFPHMEVGEDEFLDRVEQLTWGRDQKGYYMEEDGLLHYFGNSKNKSGYQMLSEISTKDGLKISFRYDKDGNLFEIIDSRNQKLSVNTDDDGRILGISTIADDERIDFVRYKYDSKGNLVETLDALNVSKYFEYKGHLLSKLTNQSGMSFYWEYQGEGDDAKCIHTWGDNGVLEYHFKYGEGVTYVTNSLGYKEEYYYDENSLIYKIIDVNGGITHQLYNEFQELEVVIDPEGFTEKAVFNDFGKVIQSIDKNGNATSYSYDTQLNLIQVNTPGGLSQSWKYDQLGRVTERDNISGENIRYTYDKALLKTVKDRQGNHILLEYNTRNDLIKLSYSNGLFRSWEYDQKGRLVRSRDVNGNYTEYTYDKADNLIRLEEPDGNIHEFSYDTSGNLIQAKDKLHDVAFTYGPMGILKSRTQKGKSVRFGYDRELQLRSIYNEEEERYHFELDGLGQVIKETGFDGLERNYIRDAAGRVSRILRPGNRWTSYLYDGAGNAIHEEHFDGTTASYHYNPDGLLIEAFNEENRIEFKRDKAGRITEEKQGEHSIQRIYDENGECVQLTSSLGADIHFNHDAEGNLLSMHAGENWNADWQRDKTGLELYRQLSGNVRIRTERDRFGRETKKSIGVNNIEKSRSKYHWSTGNRLLGIDNEKTGQYTTFDYDTFDNLIKAEYHDSGKVDSIYRAPDAIGNLFASPKRDDRKYGKSGRLLEDPNYYYHYDCEGNLCFKEFKKQQGYSSLGKEAIEKKYGFKFKSTGTGWLYEWSGNGMLIRVVNPQQGKIRFGYDALGRRVYKEVKNTRTCWAWDGNVPLHEWQKQKEEPKIDIITWIFEEGSFIPCARITDDNGYSIITNYLGTPTQMYDGEGNKTWHAELDIYGRVRTFDGSSLRDCPFRYQGQYEDVETGLYYNRFRYYDPSIGNYISQDPIGLAGNNPTLYGYVKDTNSWIDNFGLSIDPKTLAKLKEVTGGYKGQGIYVFTDAATGKPYVGSTIDIEVRMRQHIESGKLKDLDSLSFDKYSGKTRQQLFNIEADKMAELGGLESGVLANERRPRNTGDTAKKDLRLNKRH